MNLKRDLVKYIRDRAKSGYKKGTECYICGNSSNLDFHHFYSLSPLLYRWMKKRKKVPEEVLEFRDQFIHIGTFCEPVGLKGEINIIMLTKSIDSFQQLRPFFTEDRYTILDLQLLRMSKGNIVAKLFCKSKGSHSGSDSMSTSSATAETTKEKKGILSKIWKRPEWTKRKKKN